MHFASRPNTGTTSPTANNITLIFYASEVIQNFHQYDISVIGGFLSEFITVTDGRHYTAVLSPAVEYGETITTNVFVAASLFQDLATNENLESETFEWTYDTTSPDSSFNDFVSSEKGIAIIAACAVVAVVVVVGIAVMIKGASASKTTLNTLSSSNSSSKTRRPSHALDMSYDEENAISNDSVDVPSSVQQLHDL